MYNSRICIVTMALAMVHTSKPMDLSRLNPRTVTASIMRSLGSAGSAALSYGQSFLPARFGQHALVPAQQVASQILEPVHEGAPAAQISLADMPEFVMDGEICRHLPLRDIVNLRKTCRALRNAWDHERPLKVSESCLRQIAHDKGYKKPMSVMFQEAFRILPGTLANFRNKLEIDLKMPGKLPEDIRKLTRTRRLSLVLWEHHNDLLEEALAHASFFPELEELDISLNSLTTLPKAIRHLASLKRLDVSGNYLSRLEDIVYISYLTNLCELNLSTNRLTNLPEAIKNLENLRKFNCSHNSISTGAVANLCMWLPNLQDLDLSSNRLDSLPEAVKNLRNLKKLGLSLTGMSAEAIAQVCTWLPSLEELHVSLNNLTTLPEAISSLKHLRRLNLYGNRLTQEAIVNICLWLPEIEELDLGGNDLTTLPEAISSLKHLKELKLYGNYFTQEAIAHICLWLPGLEELRK